MVDLNRLTLFVQPPAALNIIWSSRTHCPTFDRYLWLGPTSNFFFVGFGRCETRPGPEYVLRAYTFNLDGGYHLIQHHYWDDSCSSPKLTVISFGKIQLRNSLIQPEAANGIAKPINISVIPQGPLANEELNNTVKKECSGTLFYLFSKYLNFYLLQLKFIRVEAHDFYLQSR